MGYLKVCNPQAHLSVDVPYIALHYLEHDSLSFAGDVHGKGRIDIKVLLDVLFRPAVSVIVADQQVTLRWMTKTRRTYQVLTAPGPGGPWTSGPVFQGNDKEQVFAESVPAEAVSKFYQVAVW